MPNQLLTDIAALPNLFLAWKKARTYMRKHCWYFDALEIEVYEMSIEDNMESLSAKLMDGTYSPDPAYLVQAPKRIERKET